MLNLRVRAAGAAGGGLAGRAFGALKGLEELRAKELKAKNERCCIKH